MNRIFLMLLLGPFFMKGQTVTQQLLRNLNLNNSVEELNQIFSADTITYKLKKTKGNYDYYSLKPDSFYGLFPKTYDITAHHFKSDRDSIARPQVLLLIDLERKGNGSKKVSAAYYKIVELLKKEYGYSKPEYIKGSYKSKLIRRRVDEWTTYYYTKKEDKLYRLAITWFDSGKYGHLFLINYILPQ